MHILTFSFRFGLGFRMFQKFSNAFLRIYQYIMAIEVICTIGLAMTLIDSWNLFFQHVLKHTKRLRIFVLFCPYISYCGFWCPSLSILFSHIGVSLHTCLNPATGLSMGFKLLKESKWFHTIDICFILTYTLLHLDMCSLRSYFIEADVLCNLLVMFRIRGWNFIL